MWTFPYWNDEIASFKYDELFSSDALLLGRVGSGQRLFEDGSKANLKLIETKTFSSSVVALIYQLERKE